jgi:hypothetical protein
LKLELVDFKQKKDNIYLSFKNSSFVKKCNFELKLYSVVNIELNSKRGNSIDISFDLLPVANEELVLSFSTFHLSKYKSLDHEYSIVFYCFNGEKFLSYLEFICQSSGFLKNYFNFQKEGGYYILGRTKNLDIINNNKYVNIIKYNYGKAELKLNQKVINKNKGFPNKEISELNSITQILNSLILLDVATGPHNSFISQHTSFRDKINLLVNNKWSVQCSDFRDLFAWVAVSSKFRVRNIDACNYYPSFPDLIPYGHSLCEIFLDSLNKWVIFDPWFNGLMIFNLANEPIGCKELQEVRLSNKSRELKFCSVITMWNRKLISNNDTDRHYLYKTSDTKFLQYTPSSCRGICQPPYLEYFKHIRVSDVKVVRKFSFISIFHKLIHLLSNYKKQKK